MDNQRGEDRRISGQIGRVAAVDHQAGGSIRSMRYQLGMTQEELAHALGITVGTVSRWEKGRFRPSRLARSLIAQFARTHNVDVNFAKPAA